MTPAVRWAADLRAIRLAMAAHGLGDGTVPRLSTALCRGRLVTHWLAAGHGDDASRPAALAAAVALTAWRAALPLP